MTNKAYQEKVEKLRELIKNIDFAMLTTVDEDGTLRSRPMSTQEADFDGDLWFLTSVDTAKVEEIEKEHTVNLSYARPDKQRYVSVSGNAVLLNDRAKIKELWSPAHKIWFPDGVDDPKLRALKVKVEKAEYWDSPGGIIATVIAFAQALAGKEAEMGENEKLELVK